MKKKEINKVINSLASVIHKDSLSASSEFINNMLQLMSKDTMTNPEMFNLFVCYPCNSQINNLIETINTLNEKSDKVSEKNLSKFVFLFKNYIIKNYIFVLWQKIGVIIVVVVVLN